MSIRVRFAPSPTGEMHVGNLRTAIINWLYAKQNNGKFFLRIEDTDTIRSQEKYVNGIMNILNWMGLNYEDEVVYQSQRIGIYNQYAKLLIEKQFAYYCQCESNYNKDDNDEKIKCECEDKKYTYGMIRFSVIKDQIIEYNDIINGRCFVNSNEIENFGLLREDGTPLYNFAVVIDDIYQKISHVIRGCDHKTNTFKQILIYNALEHTLPEHAHLPIILGLDGKKLSKRKESNNIQFLIDDGIISDALFNIAIKLGWGYKDEEYMTRDRIKEIWQLNKIKKAPSIFDSIKLYNFSSYFFRNYDYRKELINYINLKVQLNHKQINIINDLYDEVSKRSKTFRDAYEQLEFIWNKKVNKVSIDYFNRLSNILNDSDENLLNFIKQNHTELRLFITGKSLGFDLKKTILSLGRDEVLSRFTH